MRTTYKIATKIAYLFKLRFGYVFLVNSILLLPVDFKKVNKFS